MREFDRIDRITKLLVELWKIYPDLRLGQLLSNVTGRVLENNLFFYEDNLLEECLENYLKDSNEIA